MNAIKILAIESSCDDTAASIICNGNILSNIIFTQKIHEKYGGVIPESASRCHIKNILPVIEEAYTKSGITKHEIDAVAYTQSPGLIGSLLVGSCFAKSYAQALNVPSIAVNHMQAHVLSNLLSEKKPSFPFLCLTVSGGHTQIVICKSPLIQEVIGTTLDDAAGEAFDKTATMLGLTYPGGPMIDKLAQNGNENKFKFSEPNIPGLNFSFSGLKTSILYFLQKQIKANKNFINENIHDICASIQYSIVTILMKKIIAASEITGINNVCIAGGVCANSSLRKTLLLTGNLHQWNTFMPPFEYCTDNAAMIAITGYYKYLNSEFSDFSTSVSAR